MGLPIGFSELRKLAAQAERKRFKAGEFLFHQDEPGEHLFVIRRGEVEILAPSLLCVRQRGEVIGEMALVDSGKRSASARARTEVEVRTLDQASVTSLFERYPVLMMRLMQMMTQRMRSSVDHFREKAGPQAGGRLGSYLLEGRLGRGGMGSVYAARHVDTQMAVALKVTEARQDERIRREAEVLSRLDHPHIVRVFEQGQEGEWFFLAMERVDGDTLDGWIRPGGLELAEALPLARALCEALHHAHQQGVMHRDIKPANVMVDLAGRVKLVDFGLGWAEQLNRVTLAGEMVGTPLYVPPERLVDQGAREGPAGDQYALGTVFFELLTGRPPFVGSEPLAVFAQHLRARPPELSEFRADLPPALGKAIARMLAKKPAERFPTLLECWNAIEAGCAACADTLEATGCFSVGANKEESV